ncbi:MULTISPECIES: NAD-binding protein [unclassified Halanaerobium]|uniref:NAD-binding protein n=1 Tax=unclassified Halanaerobium TaxID=2641197 RepID=UPI000DF3FC86|nr:MULTISPECIES: NAD-binding protein [unclassified Halanaerobium]RCW41455.1 trk system potassium uptake protein TrkA [Halanaerobium sp. MA284_MarDTE_T2]RCW79729.1 trk system potassium uptake protein TrkA [Halanaerobium sp. DL-01]
MFIIIVGGGKLGRYLCRDLINKGHQVVVVEQDIEKSNLISKQYGVEVINGDGSEKDVLKKAGAEEADLLLAATRDDQDNMVICQLAERQFDIKRTLTTVNNPGNEKLFNWLGVNVAVSSASILTALVDQEEILEEMYENFLNEDDEMKMIRLTVRDTAPAKGMLIRELDLPLESVIVTILRGEKPIVPRGNTYIKNGDLLMILTKNEFVEELTTMFCPKKVNEKEETVV